MTNVDQVFIEPALPKQTRNLHPFFRGAAAIFFSALLTSLILTTMFNIMMYSALAYKTGGVAQLMEVRLFWLLFALSLIYTMIFGLMVEWPKSRWMIRRNANGKWLGLLVSLAVALIFAGLQSIIVLNAGKAKNSIFYGNMANLLMGLLIGATSAFFWWRLVIAPERKKRSAPVVAAQFE